MSLVILQTEAFDADFDLQAAWYLDPGGEKVASAYLDALAATLIRVLAKNPSIGRIQHFRHPKLKGFRSYRVNPPFNKHIIFYRYNETTLYAERVMHGARDLPRRLVQPPATADE